MYKKLLLVVFIVFFCIAWSNDPNVNTPVCTAEGSQAHPRIVSDGYGGAIIAWEDNRNGNRDIYAQHLDCRGDAQWSTDGIPICTAMKRQKNIAIVSDEANGAIIVWQDKRSGSYDIYAQCVDHSGTTQWAKNGVPVCTASGEQEAPKIISDGAGGAIIAWQDMQNPGAMSIIAQRIDSAGNLLWTPGGEVIFNFKLWECFFGGEYFEIVSDDSGGAIIISDYINRVQRLNADGTIRWQAGGVPAGGYFIQVASDGAGGAFIGRIVYDMGDYYRDCVYAQHLDSNGMKLWADDGIQVSCTWLAHEYFYGLRMMADTQGGCILAYIMDWDCYSCGMWGDDIYVHRIDSSGTIIWESESVLTQKGANPQLVPDGTGGVICTWQDYRENEGGIYANHITAAGQEEWIQGGVYVSTVYEDHRTVSDGAGGCIVTWEHEDNIYAQNVCDSGALGDCNWPVAVIDADRFGGIAPVTIHFDGSGSFDPDGIVTHWDWDFGGGDTSSGKKVSRTYYDPGEYYVSLRVKDNSGKWSAKTQKPVMVFSIDDIYRVVMELSASQVKASGKGQVQVRAACFRKQSRQNFKEKPIPVDIGLDFTTTSGTWQDEVSFRSGIYTRTLISGKPGTAAISALLDGDVFASKTVEFAWPLPPANVKVELKENRSLLRGEYYAYLSWTANPQEVFTPAKYRIYRSTDGGTFELTDEVDATVFSYEQGPLPAGHQYHYAISMVDSEGDESSLSTTIPANKKEIKLKNIRRSNNEKTRNLRDFNDGSFCNGSHTGNN